MLYELPNGERIETDDVTGIAVYYDHKYKNKNRSRGPVDIYVAYGKPRAAALHFEKTDDAYTWVRNFGEHCPVLLARARAHASARAYTDSFRGDVPHVLPVHRGLMTLSQLRNEGMRPRPGEVPIRRRGTVRTLWRLDQAIFIKPRGCSPTLESAIDGWNAAPTNVNMNQVDVARMLR